MNRLNAEKRSLILKCLMEGGGIRSTARIATVSPTTVMRLLRLVGGAAPVRLIVSRGSVATPGSSESFQGSQAP